MTAGWQERTVPTPAGRLAFGSAGSADGQPVVLLHSLGLNRHSWRVTATAMGAEFAVHAVDLPGHGDSDKPHELQTIEDYAGAVAGFCDALGLAGVHVVGNSLGSVVAAELATAHPQLVRSVALVGCPAWADRAARADWLHARSVALLQPDGQPRAFTHEMVAALFDEPEDEYVELVAGGFAAAGTWVRNAMWALYAYDATPAYAALRQPCLVVYGDRDWLQSTGDHLMAHLPNARRVVIEGGAHLTPVNRPRELATVLAEHVRELVPARPAPS